MFARPTLFFAKFEKSRKKPKKNRKNLEFVDFWPGFGPIWARVGPNRPKLYGPDVGPLKRESFEKSSFCSNLSHMGWELKTPYTQGIPFSVVHVVI